MVREQNPLLSWRGTILKKSFMTEYSKKVIILISNFVETMKKLNVNTDSETEEDRGKQLHAILQLENDIEKIFIQ